MEGNISILMAGDNSWLLNSTRLLIQEVPSWNVVGTCGLADILAVANQIRPQVIVILNTMLFLAHREVLTQLRKDQPNAKIIMTTSHNTVLYKSHPFASNFNAFVEESCLQQELVSVISRLIHNDDKLTND